MCSCTTIYVSSGFPELLLVDPDCQRPALKSAAGLNLEIERILCLVFVVIFALSSYGYSIAYKCDKNMENV